VSSTNEFVISLKRGFVMLRTHADVEPVVIGLFPNASDARRAMNALREHGFSAQEITAASREPVPARVETAEGSLPARGSGQWFGQLRQLYHADDRVVDTPRGNFAEVAPQATPTEFESMLGQLDLTPQDVQILDRGGSIVTVKAGPRAEEARILLEERGARIVHFRTPEAPAATAIAPATAPVVTSAPFTTPQQADPDHIQLFGEVLRVRKEKVNAGEVHVRKETVTHMETVQVPVTREHLVVEQSGESGRADVENAIRVPLTEERVHIDKDTVLREEYKVGKREVTQNESVSDNVRRERLLIDDAGVKTSE
jgi:uncharacterized protein (TIGR02271 family)